MLKSYISEEAIGSLNELLKELFKANSTADNIAYDLDSKGLHKASSIYHESVAHAFGGWADLISTVMTKLNARAVRKSFPGDEMTYNGITEAFRSNVALLEHIRGCVLKTLDMLDYDIENKDVCLILEDLSKIVLDTLYQSNIWFQYAEYYERKDKVMQFDQNFDKFNAPLVSSDSGDDD